MGNRISVAVIVLFSVLLLAKGTEAAIYYLSPTGNDSNTGTISSPWGSLNKLAALSPGDTVYCRGGVYSNATDFAVLSNAGTAQNPITIKNYQGETPVFQSSGHSDAGEAVIHLTSSARYYVIDGLTFTPQTRSCYDVITMDGQYCTLIRVTITGKEVTPLMFSPRQASVLIGGSYNLVDSSTIKYCGSKNSDDFPDGDNITIYAGSHNTVQNCTLTHGIHTVFLLKGGSHYNKILNNYMEPHWGSGIHVIGGPEGSCTYNLIDGNTIRYSGTDQTTKGKPSIEIASEHNSVRRNVMTDGSTNGIEMTGDDSATGKCQYNFIYNNTIYNHTLRAIEYRGYSTLDISHNNNTIANNILYKNSKQPGADDNQEISFATNMNWSSGQGNNFFKNNLIRRDATLSATNIAQMAYNPSPQWSPRDQTLAQVQTNFSGNWSNNYSFLPGFVNEAGYDFRLTSNSPCINVGTVINDTNAVTGGWSQLTYNGSAPDLGAYEYVLGDVTSPANPARLRVP